MLAFMIEYTEYFLALSVMPYALYKFFS